MKADKNTRRFPVPGDIEVVGEVAGDPAAPPVILMHGGGQTRHSWDGAMRELVTQGYYVINLDARGHGDSDWSPDGVYNLETMSADLLAVIETLDQLPALAGASMGAATGMYAIGNSDKAVAKALVLVDLVPKVEQAGAEKIGDFMRANPDGFADIHDAADAVAKFYPHRPRPKDPSGLMKNLRRRDNGRLYWHWDPKFVERRERAEPPMSDKLKAATPGVDVPTLLIRGMESDIVSDDGVADLRQRVPHVEVVDVAGAGHMVVGDKNDVFNKGLVQFLDRQMK